MLNICLAKSSHTSCIASIDDDEELESIILAEHDTVGATCSEAAKRLRILADRFDALAKEAKPCHAETHKRLNAEDL